MGQQKATCTCIDEINLQSMKVHELKTWLEPFQAVLEGRKTHEVRRNDRDFHVGDVLDLREWNPGYGDSGEYTGRYSVAMVEYMTPGGSFGLPDDLCVMSIRVIRSGTSG